MPVRLDIDAAGVATLALDRPAKRNALDRTMLESLQAAVAELTLMPDVRVVVVRGTAGAFCAGADIQDWVDPGPSLAAELSRLGSATFAALAALPQPSVAVLEGPAIGGGLELALACDLRIARSDARLGFPEARLGNLPAWGGLSRLLDIAGQGVARRLLLTGDVLDATYAAELGILTLVCPPEQLEQLLASTIDSITACEPSALALLKTVLFGFERRVTTEEAFASLAATLPVSRQRKQDFLDQKSRPRIGTGAPA